MRRFLVFYGTQGYAVATAFWIGILLLTPQSGLEKLIGITSGVLVSVLACAVSLRWQIKQERVPRAIAPQGSRHRLRNRRPPDYGL